MQSELEKVKSEDLKELSTVRETIKRLEHFMTLPLSVYFNAIREDPYTGGGEEFLTFTR